MDKPDTLRHLDVIKFPMKIDKRSLMISELNQFADGKILETINQKANELYEEEVTINASDLIVTDKTLIEDLKNSNYIMLFSVLAKKEIEEYDNYYLEYWDKSLPLDELVFLGYKINFFGDSSAVEGIFPIIFNTYDVQVDSEYQIIDEKNLNKWCLIDDLETCQKYINKSNTEVKHYIINKDGSKTEIYNDWYVVAVYCDKYSFEKLNQPNSSSLN